MISQITNRRIINNEDIVNSFRASEEALICLMCEKNTCKGNCKKYQEKMKEIKRKKSNEQKEISKPKNL